MIQNKTRMTTFIILAISLVIIAILLNHTFQSVTFVTGIIVPLLATLGTFFGITVFSDLYTTEKISSQIFKQFSIFNQASKAGFSYFYSEFNMIPWADLFKNTRKSFTFNVNYAERWRGQVQNELIKLLKDGVSISVYLPDNEIDEVYLALDHRYNYGNYSKDIESTKIKIQKAIDFYIDLKKYGNISVFLFPGTFQHSYYIFDDKEIVVGPQKHGKDKGIVPAFMIKEGELVTYIMEDMKRIHDMSRCVSSL